MCCATPRMRALAELLRQLCQNAQLRRKIGENAAKAARNFTWEQHAAEMLDFLKSLAEKKSSSASA